MSNQDTAAAADPAVMAKAESVATVEVALNLGSTILIGIVGKMESPEALLRNADGTIQKIARGDRIKAGTVIGIDASSVHLQKSGKVTVLQLPQS